MQCIEFIKIHSKLLLQIWPSSLKTTNKSWFQVHICNLTTMQRGKEHIRPIHTIANFAGTNDIVYRIMGGTIQLWQIKYTMRYSHIWHCGLAASDNVWSRSVRLVNPFVSEHAIGWSVSLDTRDLLMITACPSSADNVRSSTSYCTYYWLVDRICYKNKYNIEIEDTFEKITNTYTYIDIQH